MRKSTQFIFSALSINMAFFSAQSFWPQNSYAAPRINIPDDVAKEKWNEFKNKYNRRYGGNEKARFEVFKENLASIEELNQKNSKQNGNTPFGVTQFSDLSATEFADTHLGFRHEAHDAEIQEASPSSILDKLDIRDLPTKVDWREKGAVSLVKNQGQCGSCWAFSVTEQLESDIFQKFGVLPLLSAQQVNSCSTRDGGCSGGDPTSAYSYMISQGVQTESSYPYTSGESGQTGSCRYNSPSVVARLTGYRFAIPSCGGTSDMKCSGQAAQEPAIQQQIATVGPASICLSASTWQNYTGGIVAPSTCSSDWYSMDHCVQLVGYSNTGSGTPYWLVRNQWGTGWGEQGYMRLQMGTNTCGIANEVTYAEGASYLGMPVPKPSPTPMPTPTPSPSISPVPGPSCSPKPKPSPEPSPFPMPSFTPSPIPSSSPTPNPPSPTFDPNQMYNLINQETDGCVTLLSQNSSTYVARLYSCTDSKMQKFQLTQNADKTYTIKDIESGHCLSVYKASTSNGAVLVGGQCNGSAGQQFDIKSNANGSYEIKTKNSSKCFDYVLTDPQNGYPVVQTACTGGSSQEFLIK